MEILVQAPQETTLPEVITPIEPLEEIKYGDEILAIVIYANYKRDGVSFFTPENFSQQLAYMHHPTGKIIRPHIHNRIYRSVEYTQEVLVIKRGKLKVDFYSNNREYVGSRVLSDGDVILLASGGHGFEIIEDAEMIEVKQGPYSKERDKEFF